MKVNTQKGSILLVVFAVVIIAIISVAMANQLDKEKKGSAIEKAQDAKDQIEEVQGIIDEAFKNNIDTDDI